MKPTDRGETLFHMKEWFRMMKVTASPSYSNFDIAAYLAEVILLGCVALRVGEGRRMEMGQPEHEVAQHSRGRAFRETRKLAHGWSGLTSSTNSQRRSVSRAGTPFFVWLEFGEQTRPAGSRVWRPAPPPVGKRRSRVTKR